MKKQFALICLLIGLVCVSPLSGCADDQAVTDIPPATSYNDLKSVEQIGQIPDVFKGAVENNIFKDVTAFDERLLKAEVCSWNEGSRTAVQQVRMLDVYGKELAAYTCTTDDAYHISTLTATDDGGFLFVLGFSDYAYDQNTWASDEGFASRVIKCGKDGKVQFDTPLDGVEGSALKHCIEKDGQFYFFGTIQTAETKTQGVYSSTDVYLAILDNNGAVLKSRCIAGSDFDSLDAAEVTDDGFLLSISSQSDDGDFTGSSSNGYPADWVFTINGDLEITGKKIGSGRDYFDYRIGEKDGEPVYRSDARLSDFDAGTPQAFVDYGDSYLIVSENDTGVYENTPPMISSIWYYTETVYSLYDHNGKLLFRASVDSSPDYDSMVGAFYMEDDSAP